MPFTFAHPIAAAPIWIGSNRRLNLPSLIVGSMIPDLNYFLSLQPTKAIGHTFLGIFIPGVPESIGLLLVIRYIMIRPCLALLPRRLARHFPSPSSSFSPKSLDGINVVISILLGAISHLIWDYLVHQTSSLAARSQFIQPYFSDPVIYQLFQYGSSIFGLVALGIWLLKWLDRTQSRHQVETLTSDWRGVATIAICLCASGLAIIAIETNHVVGETALEVFVRALIGWISGTFVGLCLYSIGFLIMDNIKPGAMTI